MRNISWLLVLIICHTSTVFSQLYEEVRINKNIINRPLRDVLLELQSRYQLDFVYVDQQIDSIKVSVNIKEQTVEQAMKMLLSRTKLGFYFDNERIILYPDNEKIARKPFRNVFTIKGRVTGEGDEGIPFVNVYIKDLQAGYVTDHDGHYALKDIPEGIHIVQYSFVGYQPMERKIHLAGDAEVNIQLLENVLELKPLDVSPNVYEIALSEQAPLTLTAKEILHSPNLIKDMGRTLRVLPGIANNDFSAKPRVRGGSPDETAFYLDNFEIMEPFHVEEFGGLFTIFNTDYISHLKVIPGGFSPGYTCRISGVIDIKTADVVRENQLSASVDLLNTTLLAKRKITDKTDIQFSARRTYIDMLLSDANEGIKLKPVYYDLWSKVNYRANDKHSFSFNVLHATDIARARIREGLHNWIDAEGRKHNNYFWTNWLYGPNRRYQHLTTMGFQRLARYAQATYNNTISDDNRDNRLTNIIMLRHTSYLPERGRHHLEFGGEIKSFHAAFDFKETRFNTFQSSREHTVIDSINIDTRFNALTGAAFLQNTIRFGERLELLAGVRLSYFSTVQKPIALAPRFSIGYKLTRRLSVKGGYGIFNQAEYIQNTRVYEGYSKPPDDYKQSLHYILNLTWSEEKTNLIVNGYYKDNRKLMEDYNYDVANRLGGAIAILDQSFQTISGYSKGLEIIVRQKYGHSSSVSLSYSYAVNKIVNPYGVEAYRDNDRKHTIVVNNQLIFKRHWTINTYSLFYTGEPYTPATPEFIGESSGRYIVFYTLGDKNSRRLPAFYSLDIRIDKEWYFKKFGLNVYLNLMNITSHENVRNYWWVPYENNRGHVAAEKIKEIYLSKLIVSPGISLQF